MITAKALIDGLMPWRTLLASTVTSVSLVRLVNTVVL